MLRNFTVVAVLSFAMAAGWATAAKPDPNPTVTIMTQNMDDGTDQTYIIAALTGAIPGFTVPDAVDVTFAELQASNFEGRVGLMAAQIVDKQPEIVALQEVALWRTGPDPNTATTVLIDQLELLVSALKAGSVPYDVVAVNRLSDLALPGNEIGALRFTDRNAVLVRSDLRPTQLHLSNVHARTFDAALPFSGLNVTAGWISADVRMGNKRFRFVTTHLESAIPGVPEATDVQVAQAQELIHELRNLTIPVVICGDFNSDANGGSFVDATPTAGLIQEAGYAETWPATHGAGDPGLTWPFYLEDQFPAPPFFAPFEPVERIDLFFSKGMTAVSSDLVVTPAPPPDPSNPSPPPPFASDHAGVIAVFQP